MNNKKERKKNQFTICKLSSNPSQLNRVVSSNEKAITEVWPNFNISLYIFIKSYFKGIFKFFFLMKCQSFPHFKIADRENVKLDVVLIFPQLLRRMKNMKECYYINFELRFQAIGAKSIFFNIKISTTREGVLRFVLP